MQIYNKEQALKNKKQLLEKIAVGAVFIYPTDTIYGIGCDATNPAAVKIIRDLKQSDNKPFSVIASGFEWISNNCKLSAIAKKWLLKLPGPYTLILPLKNLNAVCSATVNGLNSVGVRIPKHWISKFVQDLGKPIVTTSVNISGEQNAMNLEQLQKFAVDFIIYEGEKAGKPSIVVDLRSGERRLR